MHFSRPNMVTSWRWSHSSNPHQSRWQCMPGYYKKHLCNVWVNQPRASRLSAFLWLLLETNPSRMVQVIGENLCYFMPFSNIPSSRDLLRRSQHIKMPFCFSEMAISEPYMSGMVWRQIGFILPNTDHQAAEKTSIKTSHYQNPRQANANSLKNRSTEVFQLANIF